MLQNLQSTELVYPGTQVLRSGVISGRDTSRRNVQRRYFGYAQRRAAPMELPESGFMRALGIELTVQPLKNGMGTVIGTQAQAKSTSGDANTATRSHPRNNPNIATSQSAPSAKPEKSTGRSPVDSDSIRENTLRSDRTKSREPD